MVKYVGGVMNSDNTELQQAYLNKDVLEKLGYILYSSNS